MPLYPQSVVNQGTYLDSLFFRCFQFKFTFESIEELGCASLCHARMHGLMHDGRLGACPSCLLRLMYVYKVNVCSQVTVHYWMIRVSACWPLYKRQSPSLLLLVFIEFLCQGKFLSQSDIFFHSQTRFLDAHGGHYTTTIYIH